MAARRATQADVARLAGVSQATVSMVLNGGSNPKLRVSEASRLRVLEAIERVGYVVNPLAQGLAKGRTRIIGVFTYEHTFPAEGANFFHPILVGIERAAQERSLDLLLFTSAPSLAGRKQFVDAGWNRITVADGCILIGRVGDDEELRRLDRRNYPFVYLGRRDVRSTEVPYVGADYRTATIDVTADLIQLGHRNIALFGDLSSAASAKDRIDGYRAAMAANGLRPLMFACSAFSDAEMVDLIVDHRVTAVLLGPDLHPYHIDTAARSRGLSIPDDLSVALLGEPEDERPMERAWSGFSIPRMEMGERALHLLDEIIADTAPDERSVLLPCRPIAGDTVAPPSQRALGGSRS